MAQITIDARKKLGKELLELYRELNKIIPSSINNNPHDLLKACKIINYAALGYLVLEDVDDRIAYKLHIAEDVDDRIAYKLHIAFADIYINGLPVSAYIDTETLHGNIYIDLKEWRLRTEIEIKIDLREKKVSSIKLYVPPGSFRPVARVYGDQPKDIYVDDELDSDTLTMLASSLERERKKLAEVVKKVLETPIDTKAIEKNIAEIYEKILLHEHTHPWWRMRRVRVLYGIAKLPGIKKT